MTPTSTTTLRNQAGTILRFDRVFTRDAIFNAPSRVVRSRARFLYDLNPFSRALSSRRSLRASACADGLKRAMRRESSSVRDADISKPPRIVFTNAPTRRHTDPFEGLYFTKKTIRAFARWRRSRSTRTRSVASSARERRARGSPKSLGHPRVLVSQKSWFMTRQYRRR